MKTSTFASTIAAVMIGVSSPAAVAYDFCQIVSDHVSEALHAVKSGAENSKVDLGSGIFETVTSAYINNFIKENGKAYDDELIELNEEYVYQNCVESVPSILQPSKGK